MKLNTLNRKTQKTSRITKILLLIALVFNLGIGNLMANEDKKANKACTNEEQRQFDFWIGDWDVYDAKDRLVGHNKIFPILEGCALSENWVNVKGVPGVSYNFYDAAEKKWHQTWVDQTGGALYLDGGLVDGKMVLSGNRPGKDGNTVQRITWSPLNDGRVKQHWEVSKDDGKSWSDAFVGFYKKK